MNLQIDVEKQRTFIITTVGLRSIVEKMIDSQLKKVDLLNLELDDIQDILKCAEAYQGISLIAKRLQDTGSSPSNR